MNCTVVRFMAHYSSANEKAKTLKMLTALTFRGKHTHTHTSANSNINTGTIEILRNRFSQQISGSHVKQTNRKKTYASNVFIVNICSWRSVYWEGSDVWENGKHINLGTRMTSRCWTSLTKQTHLSTGTHVHVWTHVCKHRPLDALECCSICHCPSPKSNMNTCGDQTCTIT